MKIVAEDKFGWPIEVTLAEEQEVKAAPKLVWKQDKSVELTKQGETYPLVAKVADGEYRIVKRIFSDSRRNQRGVMYEAFFEPDKAIHPFKSKQKIGYGTSTLSGAKMECQSKEDEKAKAG